MAKITIQSKWWTDPRRDDLAAALGKPREAEHVAAKAWMLAQEYWEQGELIPGDVFMRLHGAMALLTSGLAFLHEAKLPNSARKRTPIEYISLEKARNSSDSSNEPRTSVLTERNEIQNAYIYMKGSLEFLSWGIDYRQQRIAAGRKSAEKRRLLYGSAQPFSSDSSDSSNEPRTSVRTESNGLEPTSTSTSTNTTTSTNLNTGYTENKKLSAAKPPKPPREPKVPKFSTEVWEHYASGIETLYKGKPERNAKTNSQIASFLKQVPQQEVIPLVKHYLKHPSQYYKSTMHGLGPMLTDASKLLLEMRSGQFAPDRYLQNGKAPNGKWLTHDEKKRQNTISAVDELCAEVGGGDHHG